MWTDRQILILTAVVTGIVTMLTLITTADWAVTAITIPLVASSAFWSLRISRRIGGALQRKYDRRPREEPVEHAPATSTSERPEHAQRRRQRRRPRGRRDQ